MHLLLAQKGSISDGDGEAIDLGQTPGDICFLSAADTELAGLANARSGEGPGLRLVNLLQLKHPMSVDTWVERTGRHAKLIVIRILGGAGYWPYGLEAIHAAAVEHGIKLAVLPGDDKADPGLARFCTVPSETCETLWRFLIEGGAENARGFLDACGDILAEREIESEASPLLKAGVFGLPLSISVGAVPPSAPDGASPPQGGRVELEGVPSSQTAAIEEPALPHPPFSPLAGEMSAKPTEGGTPKAQEDGTPKPTVAIIFYRALMQSGQTAPIEALAKALAERGLAVLPVYVSSLKDPVSAATVEALFEQHRPDVVLNATGFAVSAPGADRTPTVLERDGAPVIQVVLSGSPREVWETSPQGLNARDLAMNVALPEVDGRVLSRAVSFKSASAWDAATECNIVTHEPVADRVAFVAELAARWVRLRRKPASEKHVAIVLANYPNRDGRLANGVGLDTPAGTIEVLKAMVEAGLPVGEIPADGDSLIDHLKKGPTNAVSGAREIRETISLNQYKDFFVRLPKAIQAQATERWGEPERDPFFRDGVFALPLARFGETLVGIQPARGYNIDPKETYHSPDLVPPHGYLAFYAYLRDVYRADAVVHMGKHGNLEWLPGKALALSETCWPEAVFGPLPHVYPFIVNDPGEGTQAKRRTSAVIIDHLTPPLTRAESYGPLKDLEALVDEYYEAAGGDPRRLKVLKVRILDLVRDIGLDHDAGIVEGDETDAALEKLDAYLCDLKEMQIRDGLHIFGRAPEGRLLTDLVTALARVPRGLGEGADQSLQRAIAADALGFGDRSATIGAVPPSAPVGASPPQGGRVELGGESSARNGRIGKPALHSPPLSPLAGEMSAQPTEGGLAQPVAEHRFDPLDCDMAAPWAGMRPDILRAVADDLWRTAGDTVERIELLAAKLVGGEIECPPDWARTQLVLEGIEERLRPSVEACGAKEIAGLMAALGGRFVEPGPSGAPTRGRPDVLPTGRNFYSVDSRAVPTETAWELGRKSAELLVTRYTQDHGEWPVSFGLTAWGTSNMRTGGDDIAQALALIGAKPVWNGISRRVTGFEIIPVAKLGRPRVDVTLRISGFFRDAFPDQIALFDRAVRAVGALEEDEGDNPVAARMRAEAARLAQDGEDAETAARRAGYRVFGAKPGAYGAGLQALIDEKGWAGKADLAEAYLVWGGYAYGAQAEGSDERGLFEERLKGMQAVVQNQDNREHDLLDSDDYYQFEGGMTAAVETLKGAKPAVYHNDHSRPERPVVRTLEEEIGRVVRARVVNPKWIAGVMRHGYKGAFEMAATVDYMFAFAATTGAVRDHHFEAVYQAYLMNETVRDFIAAKNPDALREMADRLREAIEQELWTPKSNSAMFMLNEMSGGTHEQH